MRGAEGRRSRLVRDAVLLGLAGYALVRLARRDLPEQATQAAPPEPVSSAKPSRAVLPQQRPGSRRLAASVLVLVFFAAATFSAGAGNTGGRAGADLPPLSSIGASGGAATGAPTGLRIGRLLSRRPARPARGWWRFPPSAGPGARRPQPLPPAEIPATLPLEQSVLDRLRLTSAAWEADWALVLAYLRTTSRSDTVSVPTGELAAVERRFSALNDRGPRLAAVENLTGDGALADRTLAYARYYRAIGPAALVAGLNGDKSQLEQKVLSDPRVQIYLAGRSDISSGRVDARVIAVIEYLAETYGRVTVTCLITGHTRFSRPKVVSAHIYGRAVDVSAVGGVAIYGHQQPGGLTEQALRTLLLLPAEDAPRQLISLLALVGTSFALKDHYNHIHIGY